MSFGLWTKQDTWQRHHWPTFVAVFWHKIDQTTDQETDGQFTRQSLVILIMLNNNLRPGFWPDLYILLPSSLSGGRGPGSGGHRCVEDRCGVPATLVQRRQQHSDARLRLGAHLGSVDGCKEMNWHWLKKLINSDMDGSDKRHSQSVSQLIDLLFVLLPPREPQQCVCWRRLQRHPALPLLGCC